MNSAYLAGVADSDGSFSVCLRHYNRPKPTYSPCFQLTWNYNAKTLEVFEQLKAKYGGSFFIQKVGRTNFNNSTPTIKYFAQGKALDKIILDIENFIVLKREQVQLIKTLRSTTIQRNKKSDELQKTHENIYLQMKKLNTKNSGVRKYANN